MADGKYTYDEIISQPAAWAAALDATSAGVAAWRDLWQIGRYDELIFTGCGSTYYLSMAAAATASARGLAARAVPASELWLLPQTVVRPDRRTLLVPISRSGETSETLRAADAFRAIGGRAVATITCYPTSPLAASSDLVIGIPAAQERSVAQTRSFASMLVAVQVMLAGLAADAGAAARMQILPDLGRQLLERYAATAKTLGSDLTIERFFFLGSGMCHGIAQEAMLKMKEMSLSHSEAFHVLEFRHGPKSMVDGAALVVGLLNEAARDAELLVFSEMKSLGGRTLVLADDAADADASRPDASVGTGSGLALTERLVLALPVLQLIAYWRAIAKGLDPDNPRNLTAAITL